MKTELHLVELKSRAGDALGIIEGRVEHMQEVWLKGEFYEQRLLEYIYWHFKGGVFVDVGSAIGNHSLFFAKFCEPKLVVSVEPVPESAERQARLFEMNDVADKVLIHNCALSDHEGWGRMEHFAGSFGQYKLVEGDGPTFVTTLDNILADATDRINLVKIDVEGHEHAVLKGGEEILRTHRPALFIELRGWSHREWIMGFLGGLGYGQVGPVFQDATVYEFRVG